MSDVTQVLRQIESGDPTSAAQLLPLVYEELRRLAAAKLAGERPGQTLQATALVHEAYLRLVAGDEPPSWDSRGHFFQAAAEAMRRILIDRARHKLAHKSGGNQQRVPLAEAEFMVDADPAAWLDLDEALTKLQAEDSQAARIAQLHLFAGLGIDEAGEVLQLSRSAAYRHWTYARAWLRIRLRAGPSPVA